MPVKKKVTKGTGNKRANGKGRKSHVTTDIDGNPVSETGLVVLPRQKTTNLTPVIADTISTYISQGNFLTTAVQAAGVSMSVFNRWMKMITPENLEKVKSEEEMKLLEPYIDFAEQLVQAAAQAEVDRVEIINASSQLGAWQGSAWWLERRFPQRWGKKPTHHHVTGSVKHTHDIAEQIVGSEAAAEDIIDLFEQEAETSDGKVYGQ